MYRGEIWWADLPDPMASEPGYRRPVLIIQDDTFTQSRLRTVIVSIITSNLELANAPGNVLLLRDATGLSRDSVVNSILDRTCWFVIGRFASRSR